MKLLILQETDWIKRGPHQQHHLMDRVFFEQLGLPDARCNLNVGSGRHGEQAGRVLPGYGGVV